MTRDEHRALFIAKFRAKLAGTIALGGEQIRKSLAGGYVTAEKFGESLLDLTPTTDKLLGEFFEELVPVPPLRPEPPRQATQQQLPPRK